MSRPSLKSKRSQRFQEDGFIKLGQVLDPELINSSRGEIETLVSAQNHNTKALAKRDTYKRAFLQVTNLWRLSEPVRQFVCNPDLARIAAELMGVEAVRLYHDQALFKEAGGGHTPWHRDQYYWPIHSSRTCTAWIPLQDVPREMGPLTFVPGSHQWDTGRDLAISDQSETFFADLLRKKGTEENTASFLLGDVSFHAGWTLHRAEPNRSRKTRAVMTVIYMAADSRITAEPSDAQIIDRDAFVPGREPGAACNTELNPVLWPVQAKATRN